jgi:hypothetical protein
MSSRLVIIQIEAYSRSCAGHEDTHLVGLVVGINGLIINNPAASSGVCSSLKVLQSGFNTLHTPQGAGY